MLHAARGLYILISLALACVCAPAYAWGNFGHRVTGHVASALLTPTAKTRIRQLIGTDNLSQVATYMDDHRPQLSNAFPGSDRWHYNNRPACDRAVEFTTYCAGGDCASRKIYEFYNVLLDEHSAKEEQANAVCFLVHMIGDLHQPLHTTDNNDRGGNGVRVELPGSTDKVKLHGAWDTQFLKLLAGESSERSYADTLVQQFSSEIQVAQDGRIRDWAQQSYDLAVEDAYDALPAFACDWENPAVITLPQTYVDRAQQIIPLQLARAGARIAHLLNRALDNN